MKNVYVVLTRSKTILARMIQQFTKKKYSHSSLSLHKDCATFYSFGRLFPRFMFPTGFITEGMDKGFFAIHTDVLTAVYEIPVSDEQYALIEQRLQRFITNPRHFKYSVVNIFLQPLGIAYQRENKYVCSAFIAEILDGIVDFGKPASLVYPHDFQNLGYQMIFEGTVSEYHDYYEKHLKEQSTLQ